jgi:hypothetical protein
MGVDRGKHPLANIPNYPPWLCQPYVRPPLVENKRKLASEAAEEGLQTKREHDQVEDDSTEKSAKKPCKKPMSVQTCQFCIKHANVVVVIKIYLIHVNNIGVYQKSR